MPFTNVWDVTFPPDTQFANQLGLDLRNFRTDTQQRMAAISGLDASKPAFGSDAQPANWNGILFFATDTGQIYQFNNPNWTNVTPSFKGSPAVFKSGAQISHTGTTTLDTIYTSPVLPAQVPGSAFRIYFSMVSNINGAVNTLVNMNFWGSSVNLLTFNSGYGGLNTTNTFTIDIINVDSTHQYGPCVIVYSSHIAIPFLAPGANTSGTGQILIQVQSGENFDQQVFEGCIIESL